MLNGHAEEKMSALRWYILAGKASIGT